MPDNRREEPEEEPEFPVPEEGTDLFTAWKNSMLAQRKYYEDKLLQEGRRVKKHYERMLSEQESTIGPGGYRNWRGTPAE